MNRTTRGWRKARWILLGLAAVGAVLLIGGWAAAPTTEGLTLTAVGHERLANAGNKEEASLVVAVYNVAGPVRGLLGGNFSLDSVVVPAGGSSAKKAATTEVASGVYRIDVVPEASAGAWLKGTYVIAISLTSPNGSGTTVTQLEIDP